MESDKNFLNDYFGQYSEAIHGGINIKEKMAMMRNIACDCRDAGGKLIFAGNGASASIASHSALDYSKQGGVRSVCFSSDAFITAFANDYGYENWVAKAVECHGDKGDVAVLISSSGTSKNIVNAAEKCKEMGITVITFTGFGCDTPLMHYGDLNFWLDSKSYNIIECTHMFWIMAVCDLIIGKSEYSVS